MHVVDFGCGVDDAGSVGMGLAFVFRYSWCDVGELVFMFVVLVVNVVMMC